MSAESASTLARRADAVSGFVARWGAPAVVAVLPFVAALGLRSPGRGQSYFLKIAGLGVFALFLLARSLGRVERPRLGVPDLALALCALFIALSAGLSSVPAYAFGAALPWFAGAALFLMFRAHARSGDLFGVYGWIFVAQAGPLAAYGIAQHYGYEILPYSEVIQKNRVIATFGHPNYFGSYMGPLLFICLARAAAPGFLPGRIYALAMVPLIAVALALARCRAVWLGSALGLAAAALLASIHYAGAMASRAPRLRAPLVAAGAAALLAFFVFAAVPALWPSPIRARARALVERSQWESRLYYWFAAAKMDRGLAPVGIGPGGFGQRFWKEADAIQRSESGPYFRRNIIALADERGALDPGNAHNDYLEMRAESGWAALFGHLLLAGYLVYFVAVRFFGLWGSALPAPARPFAAAALLGGFVCALFDALLGFPLALPCSLVMFWFLAAALEPIAEGAP